jgi:hypothetical protein
MVTDIVQTAICAMDGAEFTNLGACPGCGGPVQGYDIRERRYAIVREGLDERTIMVRVRRFMCRNCKKISNADEPFYHGTRIGSLVLDLFITFSLSMPASRAARVLDGMGIIVNRTTWKNYTDLGLPGIPTTNIFGMQFPSSVFTISTLAARLADGDRIEGVKVLDACGFPSVCRHPQTASGPGKKGSESRDMTEAGLQPGLPDNGVRNT